MKALILLPIYGYPFAGFGRVVSAMTHSLQKKDILVHLGVFGTPYDSIWPIEEFGLPPDKIFKAFPYRLSKRQRLAGIVESIFYFIHKLDYDLIIDAVYNSLIGFCDLGYVHVPSRRSFKDILKKFNVAQTFSFDRLLIRARKVVANSSWTAKLVEQEFRIKCEVLHPPIKTFTCSCHEKENIVLGLGRIAPDKNWEEFIKIAKRVKQKINVKFIIAGKVVYSQDFYRSYYEKIKLLGKDVVTIIANPTEQEKIKLLCKSKVLLHTFHGEHFGLAVAEAMLAGVVPVVYMDGGCGKT